MFSYSPSEQAKLDVWMAEQEKKNQGKCVGAIGGVYVHTFCDTTLGTVKRVRNDLNKEEIDLTEYDMW
jgi:transcription antitermination factor NusA-like protein